VKAYVESPSVRRKMDEDENKARRTETANSPVLSDIEREMKHLYKIPESW